MEGLKKSGIRWEMWILPTSTESLKFSSHHCSWRGQVSAILGMCPHLFGPSLSRLVQGNKDAWWPSFTLWDHTMQTNTENSVQASPYQSAGEQVAMLELVNSSFLGSWLCFVCTFLTSCGVSVLLVNNIPGISACQTSCRYDLFWVRGQTMGPCPWPEQQASLSVTTELLQQQAKDSNSAPVKTGSGPIRQAPKTVVLRPQERELPSMYVPVLQV